MPWSFVLEFHGWWHILTAVAAFVFMVLVDNLTRSEVEFSGGPYAWVGGNEEPLAKHE
jgi:dihydroceramidase